MSYNAYFKVIVWEIDATNLSGTLTRMVHASQISDDIIDMNKEYT